LEEAARREAVLEVYHLLQGFDIEFRPDLSLWLQTSRGEAQRPPLKKLERTLEIGVGREC
jgi:hypothetical protein